MKNLVEMYNKEGQIQALFKKLDGEKSTLVCNCVKYAGWTIPSLFPEDTTTLHEEFTNDYQSIGARATNHLANKLTLALFAPSRPFFRLDVEDSYQRELTEKGVKEDIQLAAFSRAERRAMKRMLTRGIRVSMPMAMKLLIVTGNALKYFPVDGSKAQVYNLRDYCIKRDLSGTALDIVTQDRKSLGTLPQEMQEALKVRSPELTEDSDVTLYTRVRLHDKRYHVFQALNEVPYGNVHGSYTKMQSPWIPMVWSLSRGKDYGTGLVEEYAGDFHALSTLSEAMVVGAAIAADIKFLVDPTGSTDYEMLNNSPSGSYVPGRADEISTVQTDKQNDWGIVLQIISQYEKRIGLAFLLGSAIQRDAERVTAEEIRFQAMELETSHAGVYSRLAEDVQEPLAYIFLKDADFDIGKGDKITPVIITGLDALSRTSEADALMMFIRDMAVLAELPEQVSMRLEYNSVIATMGASRGVEYTKYLKDEEQVQQEIAQRQQELISQQQQIDQSKAQGA